MAVEWVALSAGMMVVLKVAWTAELLAEKTADSMAASKAEYLAALMDMSMAEKMAG